MDVVEPSAYTTSARTDFLFVNPLCATGIPLNQFFNSRLDLKLTRKGSILQSFSFRNPFLRQGRFFIVSSENFFVLQPKNHKRSRWQRNFLMFLIGLLLEWIIKRNQKGKVKITFNITKQIKYVTKLDNPRDGFRSSRNFPDSRRFGHVARLSRSYSFSEAGTLGMPGKMFSGRSGLLWWWLITMG